MPEIPGIDTILGLVGLPPREIEVERKLIKKGTSLLREWNTNFLAFIPYCYVCKIPLNWYSPPEESHVFRCPQCNRIWKIV